jgi:S-adenosylmethionine:tRNA ribosyltransferase-isomerase
MTRLADFDYLLPELAIAQKPAPRGDSRMLHLAADGQIGHFGVRDLPRLLRAGDLLVVNDTRVIPARLFAHRPDTGGRLELLLVTRLSERRWVALTKPGRRARPGSVFEIEKGQSFEVLRQLEGGRVEVRFERPIEPDLERLGHVPLPPYIRRPDDAEDRTSYQTVYAARPGAIAAPTAGLHFDQALLDALRRAGVDLAKVTLHVGIGTFRPVTVDRIEDHRMDSEWFEIPPATADAIRRTRADGGRVVAVGTTVVRSLESAADSRGELEATAGHTDLFIRPGYDFRVVDRLLTNFHLPRSTLLMLVCAFAGRQAVLDAYRAALASGYRFYSYGDCMLVERDSGSELVDRYR